MCHSFTSKILYTYICCLYEKIVAYSDARKQSSHTQFQGITYMCKDVQSFVHLNNRVKFYIVYFFYCISCF